LETETNRALHRLLDANLNRLREGIRVVEDITRYLFNHPSFALRLKTLRHQARISRESELLASRESTHDVLRATQSNELVRDNVSDLLVANFKRAQESARVLEEALKLTSKEASERFKSIRYELYTLEKEVREFHGAC